MESNSFNTPVGTADPQGNKGDSSSSTQADTTNAGQSGQGSQIGQGSQSGSTGQSTQTKPSGDDSASMRGAREEADSFGRRAADATSGYLQDAKAKASATVQAGKEYAQDAVNAAGKKIDSVKGQAAEMKQRGMQFAADEPMKAVVYAAAGSAVLTALLLTWMRGRR
jgi:hypothetical protein